MHINALTRASDRPSVHPRHLRQSPALSYSDIQSLAPNPIGLSVPMIARCKTSYLEVGQAPHARWERCPRPKSPPGSQGAEPRSARALHRCVSVTSISSRFQVRRAEASDRNRTAHRLPSCEYAPAYVAPDLRAQAAEGLYQDL